MTTRTHVGWQPPALSQVLPTPQPTSARPLTNLQPLPDAHESTVHPLLSSQTAVPEPAKHTPLAQVSPAVQGSPSLQSLRLAVPPQPLVGLQVSSVQVLPSSQTLVPVPTHLPLAQPSVGVHTLPSVQGPPVLAGLWVHPDKGAQPSDVQGLSSSQLAAAPRCVSDYHPQAYTPVVRQNG